MSQIMRVQLRRKIPLRPITGRPTSPQQVADKMRPGFIDLIRRDLEARCSKTDLVNAVADMLWDGLYRGEVVQVIAQQMGRVPVTRVIVN